MKTLAQLKQDHEVFFSRGYKRFFSVRKEGVRNTEEGTFYWAKQGFQNEHIVRWHVYQERRSDAGLILYYVDAYDTQQEAMAAMGTDRMLV